MRRVRRKGGNKEKVFGCDLLEHLAASSQEIPQVLRSCCEFVEEHGIVDGIYRLSGISSNIQKLRSEFDSDASPDLNKDTYLQDIHCVSSLCKAYFRELPNPLLTYQLYDKFAEAVAVQLEEERLVKIRDVLKELPNLHYRTLEFLMCHLVRMASHSSETNMHARNLAIVWAPNLLRSKDIEASGLNGTAAFMEVRVQSIVVEFILTHVSQLFPGQGALLERRNSLPSPSALSNQEKIIFPTISSQSPGNYGNISPGDGPIAMRPYHAIIEGTDKRKGSLKGRKWMSIFNIGGRFHDTRRRNKNSTKGVDPKKERTPLRPAKSMDSLSTPSCPNEASRHPAQRPPSSHMSLSPAPSSQAGTEVGAPVGAIRGSGYAVTYRRGTGVVGGGGGTQGSYNPLDPDGAGTVANEGQPQQSRSPAHSAKLGWRSAMHISKPHSVTVPLHITSNLALGVLQGGGADKVIHCGRDKDGGERREEKERGERVKQKKGGETKGEEEGGKITAPEQVKEETKERQDVRGEEASIAIDGEGAEEEAEVVKEEKKEEEAARVDHLPEPTEAAGGQGEDGEQGANIMDSDIEDNNNGSPGDNDYEYMEMKSVAPISPTVPPMSETNVCGMDSVLKVSDILNSTDMDVDDYELSGYVQDNFEFLDHMDSNISSQKNEFSVEAPCHFDYEEMEAQRPFQHTQLNPHEPLTSDTVGRNVKSLSLPHMTLPFLPAQFSSEEDLVDDDNDDDDDDDDDDDSDASDYSSDEDGDMFFRSIPSNYKFHNLTWPCHTTEGDASSPFPQSPEHFDCLVIDTLPVDQSQSPELSACVQSPIKNQEQGEARDGGRLEEKEQGKEEEEYKDNQGEDQVQTNTQTQRTVTGVICPEVDASVINEEVAAPIAEGNSGIDAGAAIELEKEKEGINSNMECSGGHFSCDTVEETGSLVTIMPPSSPMLTHDAQRWTVDMLVEVSRNVSGSSIEMPKTSIRMDREGNRDDGGESEEREEEEDRIEEGAEGGEVSLETEKEVEGLVEEKKEHNDAKQEEHGEGSSEIIIYEPCEEKDEELVMEEEEDGDTGSDEAFFEMNCKFWEELNDIVCDVIENAESEIAEGSNMQGDVGCCINDAFKKEKSQSEESEVEDVPSQETEVSEERSKKLEEGGFTKTEAETEVLEKSLTEDKYSQEMQQDLEKKEATLLKGSELNDRKEEVDLEIQERHASEDEKTTTVCQDNKRVKAQHQKLTSIDDSGKKTEDVKSGDKNSRQGDSEQVLETGVGRKLVISKQALSKVYQVKSVPVVPPKPQHCRLTALGLRQQQQRQRGDVDRERENLMKRAHGGEEEEDGAKKERQTFRRVERERRKEWDEGGTRDSARHNPLSMCFDEAVAIATMKRGREKESGERERQRDWGTKDSEVGNRK
ncbi:uncharacterized protein si:dkeyp-68b7.12 [Lampris incognitus]|uniref:uncharacterized protein si:dkeyp-68b7.12 n=1 Tax=Lampris incognitus TaxID=2546036 RepID=UPI0024B53427|nr:uncharacterized protein si:dkeyp-68b7.12 [Lampris incognitus]